MPSSGPVNYNSPEWLAYDEAYDDYMACHAWNDWWGTPSNVMLVIGVAAVLVTALAVVLIIVFGRRRRPAVSTASVHYAPTHDPAAPVAPVRNVPAYYAPTTWRTQSPPERRSTGLPDVVRMRCFSAHDQFEIGPVLIGAPWVRANNPRFSPSTMRRTTEYDTGGSPARRRPSALSDAPPDELCVEPCQSNLTERRERVVRVRGHEGWSSGVHLSGAQEEVCSQDCTPVRENCLNDQRLGGAVAAVARKRTS